MSIDRLFGAVLCILLCALPLAAQALESDASQPIHIAADRWDRTGLAHAEKATSIYTGHVVITQGSIRVTADKAILTLVNGVLKRALIIGSPATFYQDREQGKPIHGHAHKIDYNTTSNTVVLTGNAEVHRGGELLDSGYIRYDIAQQKVVAHPKKQQNGRVHVVIPPKTTPTPATTTPPMPTTQ